MIQVFVVASVVIAIASVLAISVMQKSRQLGILKAMGITNLNASLIFLFQGLILGAVGGTLGVLLGLGLFQLFMLSPSTITPYINWGFVIGSGLVAIVCAGLASLIPARRSARLDPIEVIRNG